MAPDEAGDAGDQDAHDTSTAVWLGLLALRVSSRIPARETLGMLLMLIIVNQGYPEMLAALKPLPAKVDSWIEPHRTRTKTSEGEELCVASSDPPPRSSSGCRSSASPRTPRRRWPPTPRSRSTVTAGATGAGWASTAPAGWRAR